MTPNPVTPTDGASIVAEASAASDGGAVEVPPLIELIDVALQAARADGRREGLGESINAMCFWCRKEAEPVRGEEGCETGIWIHPGKGTDGRWECNAGTLHEVRHQRALADGAGGGDGDD